MSESAAGAPALWRHPEFRRGAREVAGVALGVSAWGVVAGIAMANSSLGTAWAVLMSLLVFSGTGQIASPAVALERRPAVGGMGHRGVRQPALPKACAMRRWRRWSPWSRRRSW